MLHSMHWSRNLSHPCGVSLQDQLLGSPHLLLLHLSADGLFGLIRQLTAGRQAGIPHHFLNTPANIHLSTQDCIFNIYCIEKQEACWEDGGGMMCSKCSEQKSNHQLQHGQQPLNPGVHPALTDWGFCVLKQSHSTSCEGWATKHINWKHPILVQ